MMYHPGLYSQRAYTGYNGYPYTDTYNQNRQTAYNNVEGNNNNFYQSGFQQESYSTYREQQRGGGTYEQRVPQLENSYPHQQDRNSLMSLYGRHYEGYTNSTSQSSQIYNNAFDYKSTSSAMMSRNGVSEHGENKYFPPCALQYYETDGDSVEDDEIAEQRTPCAYAKSYSGSSFKCDNDKGMVSYVYKLFLCSLCSPILDLVLPSMYLLPKNLCQLFTF